MPPDPLSDPLLRSVAETLAAYGMVRPGDRVLVGFSGGPDSTALLLSLYHLAAQQSISLGAAHLNHGLRGERAAEDARHAAAFVKTLDIPFIMETHSVAAYRRRHGMSPEEAAREVRYRFLHRTAGGGGFNRIALGHHRDDDAESMLMRILRGSGPLGLAGIAPKGRSIGGDIAVIRPLIRTPRTAIQAFLERMQIVAVEDESNTDVRFLRNRIRHELLPLLKTHYNPALAEGLSRMAQLMRDEQEWLGDLTAGSLASLMVADHGTLLVLDRQGLAACHPALQRRILRAGVAQCKGDLRRVGFAALEAARIFAVRGPARGALDLPDGLVIRGKADRLEVQQLFRRQGRGRPAPPRPMVPDFEYRVLAPGRILIREAGAVMAFSLLESFPGDDIYRTGQQTAFFDMNELRFPLLVRNFRPGDRLTPLGMKGTQKVKKIFSDRKVAREDRCRYPLLLAGEEILWIAGLRQGAAGRIGPQTTRWLKVEISGCLFEQDGYH